MQVEKQGEVWMLADRQCCSVAREIAIEAMVALGMDPSDFRKRDAVILGISDKLNAAMDAAMCWQPEDVPLGPSAAEMYRRCFHAHPRVFVGVGYERIYPKSVNDLLGGDEFLTDTKFGWDDVHWEPVEIERWDNHADWLQIVFRRRIEAASGQHQPQQ